MTTTTKDRIKVVQWYINSFNSKKASLIELIHHNVVDIVIFNVTKFISDGYGGVGIFLKQAIENKEIT
nr:unnamed protein product [Callosobruchus chinensis]